MKVNRKGAVPAPPPPTPARQTAEPTARLSTPWAPATPGTRQATLPSPTSPPPPTGSGAVVTTDPAIAVARPRGADTSVVNGVTIVARDCSEKAQGQAEDIARALASRPDIANGMRQHQVTLVIIPANKKMTDLPEFASLRGTSTFDGRRWEDVRGSGGLHLDGRVLVGVAEESLDGQASNQYPAGYSVGMHELAHALQNEVLPRSEARLVSQAYQARAAAGGPWTEAYGASNESEYFAQLTNAWFGTNTGIGHNGAAWVRANDPLMAAELEHLYGPPPAGQAEAVPAFR